MIYKAKDWFEMAVVRRRSLSRAVWIPLRATHKVNEGGEYGTPGYTEEYFGAGALIVSLDKRDQAAQVEWTALGGASTVPYVEDGEFCSADQYCTGNGSLGTFPVLAQTTPTGDPDIWYLHPDLVIGLDLVREGDEWLSFSEGYTVVAKLSRSADGDPSLLEIRAEHLRDYLRACDSALRVATYRQRISIEDDPGHIDWPDGNLEEAAGDSRWEGRVIPIHEGPFGFMFGEEWHVSHVSRTDVDTEEDVPDMPFPTEGSTEHRSWTTKRKGRRIYRVEGELWRNEWVEPGTWSTRIREDERPATVPFVIDAEGNQVMGDELKRDGRWLWFRPEVVAALAHRRGGVLVWHTGDTGGLGCSPGHGVHFGMNELGNVTVYAKDIGKLPEWQQRQWAGYNIGPDGGVSKELSDSQVRAIPASTHAPESVFAEALNEIDRLSTAALGVAILRDHEMRPSILERVHRFRAVDEAGLYALAKDVARLTADSIDAAAINDYLGVPKKERKGSLKTLELLVSELADAEIAHQILGPLVGAYDMRHGDAHLPGSSIDESFGLVRIDRDDPWPVQGKTLLTWSANSLASVCQLLDNVLGKTSGDASEEGPIPLDKS